MYPAASDLPGSEPLTGSQPSRHLSHLLVTVSTTSPPCGTLATALLACENRAGEIPDLDAVLGLQDSPCIPLGNASSQQPALPAFGFTGAAWAADLPFPDFTYYGHEVGLGLEDDKVGRLPALEVQV